MANDWLVPLDDDGSWLCAHHNDGGPAPPTRLRREDGDPRGGEGTSDPRRGLRCPDCGTFWRAWFRVPLAKPLLEWPIDDADAPPRFRRSPERDVDRVVALVVAAIPDVEMWQHEDVHPHDDEGVWFFSAPASPRRVQIESGFGVAPFLVEADAACGAVPACSTAETVEETARRVIALLSG